MVAGEASRDTPTGGEFQRESKAKRGEMGEGRGERRERGQDKMSRFPMIKETWVERRKERERWQ